MIVRVERRYPRTRARDRLAHRSGTHQLRNRALLVDVQGVGYEVHVATNELPPFDELSNSSSHRGSWKMPSNSSVFVLEEREFSSYYW